MGRGGGRRGIGGKKRQGGAVRAERENESFDFAAIFLCISEPRPEAVGSRGAETARRQDGRMEGAGSRARPQLAGRSSGCCAGGRRQEGSDRRKAQQPRKAAGLGPAA